MKLRLAKVAIRDLREIQAYIAGDDPAAARKVVATLVRTIAQIGERPQIGRPTAVPTIREWWVSGLPNVIPYRASVDSIDILRICHISRQRPKEW